MGPQFSFRTLGIRFKIAEDCTVGKILYLNEGSN